MSNKKRPPYYELEFSSDTTFWTEGDASSRRTWLMPVSTPSEFLAFGVLVPSKEVIFVGRGRVREDLGRFIDRMVQDGATVELYARVPLPASFVNDYVKGPPPYEGQGSDDPKDPSTPGLVSTPGTLTTRTQKQKKAKEKAKKPRPTQSRARR